MPYHPEASDAWRIFGANQVYRFLDSTATYAPDAAWPTSRGRFDDGHRPTLYVSLSAEAAVAEFYRRHPELLNFQDRVRLRTYQFQLICRTEGCDVRTADQANAVGIAPDRLVSSDARPGERYRECREFAKAVESAGGIGVFFPSAAHADGENMVVFGAGPTNGWSSEGSRQISTPKVDPSHVRRIAPS
jgi:hypothetical protein